MKSIVVSVCAKTAKEMIAGIKQAEEFADMIEVRFDCLDESELTLLGDSQPDLKRLNEQISKIVIAVPEDKLLMTLRSPDQGGRRKLTYKERELFWNLGFDFYWGDFEEDMLETSYSWLYERIASLHDFARVPRDLEFIYERLSGTLADIIKIAVQTDDISDGLPLWKLLKKAKSENKLLVPIAMGEAGKWTRILGLAYGAPMTYASLEAGKEAAPGQISAKDLRDVYRVKELTEATEVYGVIGDPVKYSLSPYMQNGAFKEIEHDAVFIPFEVRDLRRFVTEFIPESGINLKGFSITIPHKQAIIEYLDEIDETAKVIGAVNTVKIVDGKLRGYNTDAHGFITPLKKALGEDLSGKTAAILGAGGASRACIYALHQEGVNVTVFARDVEKARPLAEQFDVEVRALTGPFNDYDIVVNATPLGTKGENEDKTIAITEQLKGVTLAYDLVYNPNVTRFMREAEAAGVPHVLSGLDMLAEQGAKQFEIWTGKTAPLDEMKKILLTKFSS